MQFYHLKREEHPYWLGCDAPFTVRHILLECSDFSHIRNKYFHVDTIKQLFNDVPIDNVFLFLRQIIFLFLRIAYILPSFQHINSKFPGEEHV